MFGKRILLKIAAITVSFLLLWFSAGLTDYMVVFKLGKEPVFCLSHKIRDDAKIHFGLGYTYTFITENDRTKYINFENIIGANVYWVDCSQR